MVADLFLNHNLSNSSLADYLVNVELEFGECDKYGATGMSEREKIGNPYLFIFLLKTNFIV